MGFRIRNSNIPVLSSPQRLISVGIRSETDSACVVTVTQAPGLL